MNKQKVCLLLQAAVLCCVIFPVHVTWAQENAEQEPSPAIVLNSTGGPVDYYVILTDGSSKFMSTIQAGEQAIDSFYEGEQIMVTPTGTDSVIAVFNFDGTPYKVLQVDGGAAAPAAEPAPSAPIAAPPDKRVAQTPAPAPVAEAAIQRSADFEAWAATDKPYYEKRVKNSTTYQAGFQEKFRMEDQMRKGYNIIKMNPSRLTERGLRGNAPDLIRKLTGEGEGSYNWGIRELGFAMPNDLVLLPEQARTKGVEQTTVIFSSTEERRASSVNVGASLDVMGKKPTGGGERSGAKGKGGSAKIGISREETKFESQDQSMIRKQIVGEAYWVVYAKEHMQLADSFKSLLLNPSSLQSYADFRNLFERYGTHWPVATLFGGYIRYEEFFDTQEMAESVSKTLSVSASAKVPVPKVPSAMVGGNVDFTQSNTNEMRTKQSQGKASFESQGGQPGASFGMWNMASPTQADNYVPLKVELRGINELIWPELMGVTDPAEAMRINALRVRMGEMLERYIDEFQGVNETYDWSPRLYEVTVSRVVVTQDDDEGSANEPDFAGTIRISAASKNNGAGIYLSNNAWETVWTRSDSDPITKGKSATFDLKSGAVAYVSVPATARQQGSANGRPLFVPEFRTGGLAGYFDVIVVDKDNTGDDEVMMGNFTISIDDVETAPNKVKTDSKEFEDEGVGIRVYGQVKRVNYQIDNEAYELLPLPGLDRLNQGAAIASRASSQAPVVSVATAPGSVGVQQSRPSPSNQPARNLPRRGLITDGSYYWVLNGDGSRSWLSRTPSCAARAFRAPRSAIDAIPKRHGGTGGYTLKGADLERVCSFPQGQAPLLLTNGSYYWFVNSDGSRNWLQGSVPAACQSKAARVSSPDAYPKRHGGSDNATYGLRGADLARACSF